MFKVLLWLNETKLNGQIATFRGEKIKAEQGWSGLTILRMKASINTIHNHIHSFSINCWDPFPVRVMSFPLLNGELSLAGLGRAGLGWLAHLLEHFNSATIRLHRNGMGSFSEAYEKFIRYSICLEVYINIDTMIMQTVRFIGGKMRNGTWHQSTKIMLIMMTWKMLLW